MSSPLPTTAPPDTISARGAAPEGVRSVRLGELDSGVVAIGGRGGTATVTTSAGSARLAWWIGAEDRWHRPEAEPSARDRLLDGTPVVETSVRIPSGDAVGRMTVARVDGVARPSVVVDVENASPIPVAFAYVVESTRPITVDEDGLTVDGVGTFTLTRPALGWATGADVEAVAAILASSGMTSDRPTGARPGAVAVLVPLPHTAHAVATFTPGATDQPAADERRRLADREAIPSPDQVVAGWAAHRGSGVRLDLADGRHREALDASVCDVLLGAEADADPAELALVVEALGRLGRVDDVGPLADLLDLQQASGAMPGADPVVSTARLLGAIGAWWSGGFATPDAEQVLGAAAEAARWLAKRRRRAEVDAAASVVAPALRAAAAMFADLDQPLLATAVLEHAARLEATSAVDASSPDVVGPLARRADGLAWGVADGRPLATASAAFVIATLDTVARDAASADHGTSTLEMLAGWDATRAGESFEAHDVAVRAGRLSYGLRWHGERPALLWELTPWPDRPAPATSDLRLVAPSVDPTWRGEGPVGEALLARPAGAVVASDPATQDHDHDHDHADPPADGGSFS